MGEIQRFRSRLSDPAPRPSIPHPPIRPAPAPAVTGATDGRSTTADGAGDAGCGTLTLIGGAAATESALSASGGCDAYGYGHGCFAGEYGSLVDSGGPGPLAPLPAPPGGAAAGSLRSRSFSAPWGLPVIHDGGDLEGDPDAAAAAQLPPAGGAAGEGVGKGAAAALTRPR
ncbi:hypothetical protein MNEG_2350 [Monoraphidium neglectum]|uniref:Uncharacterized protein n=1 Tax=Monoraphidium neglectum TaxID=145388 RepID=A0A0D2LGG9_9CHLO|nr:hypothetical protein MNEG_2350 [Monoraphidium neglectum]KIZ05614.1 hypothetical protein MNEG_2350 [Monoraphidium neglectum]|eukprot:XP_013904633.1 hypothetical protein MNEG_2350 [Monoraphidium neglectum]